MEALAGASFNLHHKLRAREVTAAESTAFLGIAGILATTDLETVERVDAEDRRENEGENASAFVLFVRGAVSVGG